MRADLDSSDLVELESTWYENNVGLIAFPGNRCGGSGGPRCGHLLHPTHPRFGSRPPPGAELEACWAESEPPALSEISLEELLGSRPPDRERPSRQGDPRPPQSGTRTGDRTPESGRVGDPPFQQRRARAAIAAVDPVQHVDHGR